MKQSWMVLVLGCASVSSSATISSPASPASPAPASVSSSSESCPLRARVEFRRRTADGTSTVLALECGYEGPTLILGEMYEWGEGGTERIAIDQDAADAIWRVAQASRWRDWDPCPTDPDEAEDAERWSIEIEDGSTALNRVRCVGALPDAWRATFDALERAMPRVEEFDWPYDAWPYDGEYWRDELGYYRR